MSEIFNLILWNRNVIESVYIFIGKNIELSEADKKNLGSRGKNIIDDSLWNKIIKEQIPYKIIPEFIYHDDTILRIKEKILRYTNIGVSMPEMYLFTLKKALIHSNKNYNELTQDEFLDLNHVRMETFLKNVELQKIHTSEPFDINTFINERKSLYLYSDFISLNNISFNKENVVKISLGTDTMFN